MSRVLKSIWPTFEPIDPNATCKLCGNSWQYHGIMNGHCPADSKSESKPVVSSRRDKCIECGAAYVVRNCRCSDCNY